MFTIFREEKIITICMLSFFGASILMRVLLGFVYRNMIREAENMATTDHKLLKQCKLKFANCFQLNNGVANIPVFVDKFINRLALGPLSFESMYHLSGQTMLLSIVCAGVGICKCIMDGRMLGEILPFYIVSFLELYLYFSISTMLDIKGKKRVLKINLVDYLENHLSSRIGVTEDDMEMLYGRGAYGPSRSRRSGRTGKNGRRTVELMPIGTRLSLVEENVQETGTASAHESISTDKLTGDEKTAEGILQNDKLPGETFTRLQEQELEELLKEFLTS